MTHRVTFLSLLKHVVLFTLFAPAFGFVLLTIFIGLMAEKDSFWEIFYLFYFLPLAYYAAGIPSALAGLLIGLIHQFYSLKNFFIRCTMALCSAALFVAYQAWRHPNEDSTAQLIIFSALPGWISTFVYLTVLKRRSKDSS